MTFDDYYCAVMDADEVQTLEQLYNNLVLWNRELATAAWYAAIGARNVVRLYQGDALTNKDGKTQRIINADGRWPITGEAAWFGFLCQFWPDVQHSAA